MDSSAHRTLKNMSPLFPVQDLKKSTEFYTDQLGFKIDFQYEDFYVGISKDGFSIHLKSAEASLAQANGVSTKRDVSIIFSVVDIESLYKEFSDKSIQIIQPLRQMPYGKEFYIADPDGYIHAYVS